ncbi:MAG: translation elongation factor Ts [Thermogutta sp.]|nr:translation elongation factor Ts [Thermogutta sp.]
MSQISAAVVKALRERTGLPMMDCKRALEEAAGDAEKAIEILRKAGQKVMEKRADRETAFGRIAIYQDFEGKKAAMVELLCESAPVAKSPDFIELAEDLVQQLALGPGAGSAEELLAQPSRKDPGRTLQDRLTEVVNRIREGFRVGRILRLEGSCGAYLHHDGGKAALVEVEGGDADLAKEICMHVVAMRPKAMTRDQLDPALVAKEREILTEVTRQSGKPENIIPKIVEGRMKDFYAQNCLVDQPFVKEPGKSVGQFAGEHGMKLVRFVYWEVGKE